MPKLPAGMTCQHFMAPLPVFEMAPDAADKIGALYGFRRRWAWETERAYRQSLSAYLATR